MLNFLAFSKMMPLYFEKCCFDSKKIGVRNEFDMLSCEGKHSDFGLFFHRTKNEYFHCLNRKQLGKYYHCVLNDQKVFCPEKCAEYAICKLVAMVFENLQDSYFFYLNKYNFQPVLWRDFYENGNKSYKFRSEIAKNVEGPDLVLDYGKTC